MTKQQDEDLKENMFQGFSKFFKKPPPPSERERSSHLYELIVSVWTMSQRGVTVTILKGEKTVWEHKSNNPHSLQSDVTKANHMLSSIGLNPSHVRVIKKLNGKVIDDINDYNEAIELEEARRVSKVSAVAPPKRFGLKVGDINEIGDNQVEIILPRNDLDERKKLLKPLIDQGYKIINTVRNMKMDIVNLKKIEENVLPSDEKEVELNEYVLNVQQRRKRALTMKRYKTKIRLARERKAKRLATTDQLKVRARRMAIQLLRRRFAGKLGMEYKNLSPAQKIMIDKRIESKRKLAAKIAIRILPRVRKAEIERFRNRNQNKQNTNAAVTDIK